MANSREQSESVTGSSSDSVWSRKTTVDYTHSPVHDIVCVGFGCNAISLAIALREKHHDVDILYLDRQSRSTYVPFHRLPGSLMQLSFLNDLVTQENPRSKFSFVNYLHSTDQLIQFTNLGSIQPLREQFARYLGWCADQFKDNVRYGSEVQTVRPARVYGSSVDAWSVEYVDVETGSKKVLLAKQVICAGGSQLSVPSALSSSEILDSVSHSSNCQDLLSALSKDHAHQYHLAVVGSGQEAAEIVDKICSMRNSHKVTWIKRYTDRSEDVDQELSHRLYERQYSQRVRESDAQRWTFKTHSNVDLRSAHRSADGKVHLSYTGFDAESGSAGIVCDFVIAATGYEELDYKQLLAPVQEVLYGDQFSVNKHRSVHLKPGIVEQDCGIWVLGSNERGDQSLGQMATNSKHLAESLMKKRRRNSASWRRVQPRL